MVSAAVSPSGVCASPITLTAGTTGRKGKLKVTMPYGRWQVKAAGTEVKTVQLRSSNTTPCTVVLVATTPTITAVTPSTVSIDGGTAVSIVGTNLGNETTSTVLIGDKPATITTGSATSLSVVAPPNKAGTYPLTVTSPQGTVTEEAVITYAAAAFGGLWTPDLDSGTYPVCPAT